MDLSYIDPKARVLNYCLSNKSNHQASHLEYEHPHKYCFITCSQSNRFQAGSAHTSWGPWVLSLHACVTCFGAQLRPLHRYISPVSVSQYTKTVRYPNFQSCFGLEAHDVIGKVNITCKSIF